MSVAVTVMFAECPSCGKKDLLVPGPLGSGFPCTCGTQYDDRARELRYKGPQISSDLLMEWFNKGGSVAVCGSCGSGYSTSLDCCPACSSDRKIVPDFSKVPAEVRKQLRAMGIDLTRPEGTQTVSRDEISRKALQELERPVEEVSPSVAVPAYAPMERPLSRREAPSFDFSFLTNSRFWSTAGLVVLALLLVAGLVWALWPHSEDLTVRSFRYQQHTGFSYLTPESGECNVGESNCPPANSTPGPIRIQHVQPSGNVLIGETEVARVETGTITEYEQDGGEVSCGSADLDSVVVEVSCTKTPYPVEVEVTRVKTYVTPVYATATPYDVKIQPYVLIVRKEDTADGQVFEGRPDLQSIQSSMPSVPYGMTPEPSLNRVDYTVVFTNKDSVSRSMPVTDYATWSQFHVGTTYFNSTVSNGGIVYKLGEKR